MANAKPHVKKHLEKSHVNPNQVDDRVIAALNNFTEPELNALYDQVDKHGLGDTLEEAYPGSKQIIAAVH
jgi:hypothetical protein